MLARAGAGRARGLAGVRGWGACGGGVVSRVAVAMIGRGAVRGRYVSAVSGVRMVDSGRGWTGVNVLAGGDGDLLDMVGEVHMSGGRVRLVRFYEGTDGLARVVVLAAGGGLPGSALTGARAAVGSETRGGCQRLYAERYRPGRGGGGVGVTDLTGWWVVVGL